MVGLIHIPIIQGDHEADMPARNKSLSQAEGVVANAVGAAIAALRLGAAGNWFIATQWQGDSAFPPGYLNADLLNALSKTFNTLFYIGFALFAVSTVLVIAGVATRENPLGFQVVAINWVLLAASWLVIFVVLFVLPYPGGD